MTCLFYQRVARDEYKNCQIDAIASIRQKTNLHEILTPKYGAKFHCGTFRKFTKHNPNRTYSLSSVVVVF